MVARLRDPFVLLVALSVLSLAARLAWLDEPCRKPCRSASDRVLVFDERYYVNAARVIAGIHPPAGTSYAGAPLGTDPNSEHPQLAKVIMAGAIELFGDDPFGWRSGSILFGSLALLGCYALARAAGASRWVALGASALMAVDNLMIVHGRIGTLDIYALAAMIWGATFYLRRRPLAAGLTIGIGAGMKEVAAYALIALAVLEVLRLLAPDRERYAGRHYAGWRYAAWRNGRWASLAVCTAAAAISFLAGLTVLDRIAPPYNVVTGKTVSGGALGELSHIVSTASSLSSAGGIASYPWQWLGDYRPIVYLNINPSRPVPGLTEIHPAVHFLGIISPPIMLLAIPGLLLAALGTLRSLPRRLRRLAPSPSPVATVGLAWFLGTFAPFEVLSLLWARTSYLFYMLIVMPGIYLVVADLVARSGVSRKAIAAWAAAVAVAAVLMYPLTPLP